MLRKFLSAMLGVVLAVAGMEPVGWAQFTQAPDPDQQPYAGQAPSAPQYPSQGQYGSSGYPQQSQGPQYPQYSAGSDSESDPADRQHGVARVSIVQGDVNVRRGDTGQLEAAVINAPMMASDHLQTSPGSRAEVELDSGNLVRMGPNTDIGFADLEYRRYQIQLAAGTIIYRVLRDTSSQAEVDTPNIAFRPLGVGEYRISVLENDTTEITVRSGQAEIDGPNGSQQLAAGRTTLVRGNPNEAEFQTTYEVARDQLDDWSANRDRELLPSQSYRYVSPDIYGADDLDHYGNWVPSQYGQVWEPQPPTPDWSPYTDGQWDFEPYYGWTWVDAAPWGWAPYHYGRWFHNGGHGWCWWPGVVGASYWWHPAVVGFFGWGGGVGIGFGGLGWVALAPFEAFHPWWGHGYRFWGRENVGRMYRNAAFRGGAITASLNRFSGPNQRFNAATRGQLTSATLFRGQVPVSPTGASYRFANRQAVANPRLASAANRQFFHSPQRAFGHAQTAFAGGANSRFNAGQNAHGLAPNMHSGYVQGGTFGGRGNYAAPSRQAAAGGGWQRFGDPRGPATVRQNFAQGNEQSGWHRFGQPPPTIYGRTAGPPNENRYGGARYGIPSYGFAAPRQGFGSGYGTSSMPRYSAPAAPRYSAPASPRYIAPPGGHYSAPHYSAPPNRGGGGGSYHGGGGSSHPSGGGVGHRR
jgi:hypothetical protein